MEACVGPARVSSAGDRARKLSWRINPEKNVFLMQLLRAEICCGRVVGALKQK
jgi:hypothetical protein